MLCDLFRTFSGIFTNLLRTDGPYEGIKPGLNVVDSLFRGVWWELSFGQEWGKYVLAQSPHMG